MFANDVLISLKCSAIILHCCYMSRIDLVPSAPEQLFAEGRKVHLQNTHRHQQKASVLFWLPGLKFIFAPQAARWSTVSYLSFIHGVIADVHHRPRVCLGGSV